MEFSSNIFLYFFLPAVLITTLILPRRWKNCWLLAASLFFYAWGEVRLFAVLLSSIGMNYVFGIGIEKLRPRPGLRTLWLALAISANLGILLYFKYSLFLLDNLNSLLSALGAPTVKLPDIALPAGISFLTFHAISYLIDVRRAVRPVNKNPIDFALFISFFPQLIAGPIIRYFDVASQFKERRLTAAQFAYGVRRFLLGLAKKVLIANNVAILADKVFGLPVNQLTSSLAWLGALAYTGQIYFDFSGYSDMAIGLGHMFGFHFRENFDHPYISQSIKEFWQRWHISLSTWLRDFLFLPVAYKFSRILDGVKWFGLRDDFWIYGAAIMVTMLLAGLWHGAKWTFVVWGGLHGAFLFAERARLGKAVRRLPRPLRHLYAMLVLIVAWVFFRAETLSQAFGVLMAMVGLGTGDSRIVFPGLFANNLILASLIVGFIASIPLKGLVTGFAGPDRPIITRLAKTLSVVGYAIIFILCAAALARSTHNPFIYFRF